MRSPIFSSLLFNIDEFAGNPADEQTAHGQDDFFAGEGHLQADEHHGKSEALHDDGLEPFGDTPPGGNADEAADKDGAAVGEGSDHGMVSSS